MKRKKYSYRCLHITLLFSYLYRLRFPSVFIVYHTLCIFVFGKSRWFVLLPFLHVVSLCLHLFPKMFLGSFYKLTSWLAGNRFAHQRTSWMPLARVHPFAVHTVNNLPFVIFCGKGTLSKQVSILIISSFPCDHVLRCRITILWHLFRNVVALPYWVDLLQVKLCRAVESEIEHHLHPLDSGHLRCS